MQRNVLSLVGVFLAGLLIGWLALGWWLWPVAYVGDAYTYELNQQDKLAYASAVVDSFALTRQVNPAWFSGWYTDEVRQVLDQVAQANPAKTNWARALANQVSVSMPQPMQVKAQNQASQTIPTDSLYLLWLILIVIVVCAVVLGVVFGIQAIWHGRVIKPQSSVTGFDQAFVSRTTEEYIPVHKSKSAPLTTARLEFGPTRSNDQYFPIERDGEQIGEFGVSQVADQPAWDVWLHDQEAIVTITKVLANQPSEELASRGEVISWGNGPFTLDTPNLKLTGKALMVENSLRIDLTVEGKKNAE